MSLLKELMLGPSGISSFAVAADEGSAREAMRKADKEKLKKKKRMRQKMMKEARNYHGEREFRTYAGWKRAVKKDFPNATFRGDKDIGAAVIDGKDVGEWDGAVGSIYILEDAAGGAAVTGAHNIAGNRPAFFGDVDEKRLKKQREKLIHKIGYRFIEEAADHIEALTKQTDFNPSDVLSKLDAAEKQADVEKDTVAFGMEDEEGNIVKVYVPHEQADEFEMALGQALAGSDDNADDENTGVEIAEVLFDLKDKFDIVAVEWGDIPQDEDEEQELPADGADDEVEGDSEGGDIEGEDVEGDDTESDGDDGDMVDDDSGAGDEDEAVSALQQVIDLMKADAEAKTAEANAKKAEANADEAKYTAQASVAKVRQEEQILDMEATEDEKKKQDKEASTLAKLARYQHEKSKEAEDSLTVIKKTNEEEEEEGDGVELDGELDTIETNVDGEVTKDELSRLIFNHLKSQG